LVAGGPGTGKTILTQEFLFNGINKFGENGVYIDLTEVKEKLVENLETLNFYNSEALESGKLSILDIKSTERLRKSFVTGPREKTRMLGHSMGSMIKETIEKNNAKRLVVDSLTAIYEKFDNNADMRSFVFEILSYLSDLECTSLFISEIHPDPYRRQYSVSGVEEFMLDGIIFMSDYEHQNNLVRSLQIIKLRGAAHSRAKHSMLITNDGILLTP